MSDLLRDMLEYIEQMERGATFHPVRERNLKERIRAALAAAAPPPDLVQRGALQTPDLSHSAPEQGGGARPILTARQRDAVDMDEAVAAAFDDCYEQSKINRRSRSGGGSICSLHNIVEAGIRAAMLHSKE